MNKKYIPIIILAFFGLLFCFIGIFNHYYFKTFTYDYANYNFAFWDYSHFRISQLPTFRGNFLQDHFSFTLMYFVPLYWLFNWLTGTYTLILIQNAFVLLAAWYSYKIVKLKTDNNWISNGVLIYFFLLFGRYSAFGTDVNLAILSACFVPVFLYYFEVKKYTLSFVILILSLLSRENMPLWFISVFMVLIVLHWKDKKIVGLCFVGIVLSALYFVMLFRLIIPHIETPDAKYALFNYSALGDGPGEALVYIFKHPLNFVKLFFVNHLDNPEYDHVKMEFYLLYLISGGFILFLRPKYLIWFVPIVAQKVLNDDPFRWGNATYYAIEVVTLLPLSVYLVISSLHSGRLQKALVVLSCVGALGMTIHKMDSSNHAIPWTFYKSKINFYNKSFYQSPFDIKKVNKLLKRIPKDARVSCSNVFTPHLAQRQFVYFFPTVKDAEYIVFSLTDNNYLLSPEANDAERQKYLDSPGWEITGEVYPVFLLKKRARPKVLPAKKKIISSQDTILCNVETIDYKYNHILFSNNQKADTITSLSEEAYKSGGHSIRLDANHPFSQGIKLEDISRISKLEIRVWVKGTAENAFIVVDNKKGFYRNSNAVSGAQNGWNEITMSLHLPSQIERDKLIIYLWNSGKQPAWFDDLSIVKTNL